MSQKHTHHDHAPAAERNRVNEAAERPRIVMHSPRPDDGPELYDRQLALELEQSELGAELVRHRMEKRHAKGQSATTGPGRELVSLAVPPLADEVKRETEEKRRGRPSAFRQRAIECDPLSVARIAVERIINDLFSTDITGDDAEATPIRLAKSVGEAVETHMMLRQFEKEKPRLYRRIDKGLNEQGATPVHKRRRLIHAVAAYGVRWGKWSAKDREHVGGWLLGRFIDTSGMLEPTRVPVAKGKRPWILTPKPETLERFQERAAVHARLRPYLLPMLVPPRPWQRDPKAGGGYIDPAMARTWFLLRSKKHPAQSKESRRAINDARRSGQLDTVRHAVNAIQATPWRINRHVLAVVEDAWKRGRGLPPGIPDPNNEPLPEKPDDIDTNAEARERWKKKKRDILNKQQQQIAKRRDFLALLGTARRFADEPAFYLPHLVDFRGRVYSAPRDLKPQGSDLEKGLLEFAEGKPIDTDKAERWLLHHGKSLWDDAWDWGDDEIKAVAADPIGCRRWESADEPFQFLAWCYEWAAYLEQGRGYVSHLPVGMDGKCNGIQHLTLLARDEDAAPDVRLTAAPYVRLIVNPPARLALTPPAPYVPLTDARANARSIAGGMVDIYERVAESVDRRLAEAGNDPTALAWRDYCIDRAITKQPVMTLGYGSTRDGIKDEVAEALQKAKRPLPPGWGWSTNGKPNDALFKALIYLAGIIDPARRECLNRPVAIMEWLQEHARIMNKENLPLTWTTPAGFPVHQECRETKEGVVPVPWGGGNRPHEIAAWHETDAIDGSEQRRGITPNFVHSLDAAHLHRSISRAALEGVNAFATAHDCFSTHAADAEKMHTILLHELAAMYHVRGGYKSAPMPHPLEQFQEGLKRLHPDPDAVEWPELPDMGTYRPLEAIQSKAFA